MLVASLCIDVPKQNDQSEIEQSSIVRERQTILEFVLAHIDHLLLHNFHVDICKID